MGSYRPFSLPTRNGHPQTAKQNDPGSAKHPNRPVDQSPPIFLTYISLIFSSDRTEFRDRIVFCINRTTRNAARNYPRDIFNALTNAL